MLLVNNTKSGCLMESQSDQPLRNVNTLNEDLDEFDEGRLTPDQQCILLQRNDPELDVSSPTEMHISVILFLWSVLMNP